jgi:hypothetical protein
MCTSGLLHQPFGGSDAPDVEHDHGIALVVIGMLEADSNAPMLVTLIVEGKG